ncbi:MAG: AAA family ATPase [Bacilli bacterium]|nr:AAA family ATPase [Bacilli bacterium]
MKYYIKGIYRKSIFMSDKGYIIGLFKVKETNIVSLEEYVNKTITFTGYFHELSLDDSYVFYGDVVIHPRYGMQFNVSEYEKLKPTDKEGVVEFLSSDLFPGIGEVMAKTIVDTLGEGALDEILKDKSCLSLVPKLTQKKIDKIYDVLSKYDESHQTIVFLTEMGFSMKDALIIYNQYKHFTMDVINKNIYKLSYDIPEISFLKIDSIALKQDVKLDDERRVKAAILYVMNGLCYQNGDAFLTRKQIVLATTRYLKIEINDYDAYFKQMEEEYKIRIVNDDIYLKEIWDAEESVIDKIYMLSNKKISKYDNLEKQINVLEEESSIVYNDKQKEAIIKSLENNVLIITGGPGTGKTTIIKAITQLYGRLNKLNYDGVVKELALLAPTGRASKRLSEATLLPASTIHRFLKWNKDTNEFLINEANKDFSKLVIIEEVSMIDIHLFDSLL